MPGRPIQRIDRHAAVDPAGGVAGVQGIIIVGAVVFGTLLEEFDLLAKLVDPILERAKTTGRLIAAVVATAIGLNIIAADQDIALVLPARLYRTSFEKHGLKPQNLSRACADGGTVTTPLVPWNSCGAYMGPRSAYPPCCICRFASSISPHRSCRVCWGLLVSRLSAFNLAKCR